MQKRSTLRIVSGLLMLLFVLQASSAMASGRFAKAKLLVPKNEEKMQEVDGTLVSDSGAKKIFFEMGNRSAMELPYGQIKSILYEKAAKPRYAAGLLLAWPLLFTKSKKHYVTFQYVDASGQGKFEIVRLDKKNFTLALATLEADTGIKVERTEEH